MGGVLVGDVADKYGEVYEKGHKTCRIYHGDTDPPASPCPSASAEASRCRAGSHGGQADGHGRKIEPRRARRKLNLSLGTQRTQRRRRQGIAQGPLQTGGPDRDYRDKWRVPGAKNKQAYSWPALALHQVLERSRLDKKAYLTLRVIRTR